MPSSTSNSESSAVEARPGFVRLTASDRPGVAQPVPERDLPPQPWGPIWLGALLLLALLVAGWETYWRAYGAVPGLRNSNGAWAEQRRRLDHGEGDALVIIGSSRLLFDLQLPQWRQATGETPIQLALEGTSPVPVLEDLAADPKFTGRVIVGVDPTLFFTGAAFRANAIKYAHHLGPSQRSGQWLSERLVEPYFAFFDPDFALATVVKRQPWPPRPGLVSPMPVRKLMISGENRDSQMWAKVYTDPAYRDLARRIWAQRFHPKPPSDEERRKMVATLGEQIDRTAAAVATLRGRGVRVVLVRAPSSGDYLAFEQGAFPRARTWDVLLAKTGAPGIHFEDHPALQGYDLPEWSHMTPSEARRFTAAIAPMIEQALASPAAPNKND